MLKSFQRRFEKSKPIAERCRGDAATKVRLNFSPYYHVIESPGAGLAMTARGGRPTVMMCSNEYLGLSHHPQVQRAAKEAIDKWGTSPCGSRLANGTRAYHLELEDELAAFLGKEACHVSVAGYMAQISVLSAIAKRKDAILVGQKHSRLAVGRGAPEWRGC